MVVVYVGNVVVIDIVIFMLVLMSLLIASETDAARYDDEDGALFMATVLMTS